MPKLNAELAQVRIASVFNAEARDGVRRLAEETGIPYGTLRNAVYGHDEMALYRIVRIEKALGLDEGALVATNNDGVPDTPPEQPTQPPGPPGRTNGDDDRRGPSPTRRTRRRRDGQAAVA